ncbi:MAG: DEAD/DEAH box helicase [Christensenellales bacterium]
MDLLDKAMDSSRAKKLDQKLDKILALDATYSKMSDDELKQKSAELVARAKNGEKESKLMPEAFALVREATWRVLGMKQYPVQLKGGISIAEGNLAEMATGEGKTIVVPLVAYLHALYGENVHVVTSNEYLAKRDSEQMSKLFGFLGMSVGLSTSQMDTKQKQNAYACNVTYTTATELGFDYLRDNSSTSDQDKVLRGLNSIVIDEADNALLDEASTPLILAKQEDISKFETEVLRYSTIAINSLVEETDFYVDTEHNCVSFSEEGIAKLEKFFHVENLFNEDNQELLTYCNNALKARALFKKDINYVVKDGKVQIVGETTGRILDGRHYSHGIQQAIESKEGLKISPYSTTQSSINFQNFFKLYENIGGMSGTCKTDQEELEQIYGLHVDKIETNKPIRRTDEHFRFYHTLQAKNEAMKKRILELHESGRPILIGTTSVENSIALAELLESMGLEFNLLNAINDEEESKIIAQAGKKGAITIATNMAGRGTDIKLGGNPTFMAKEEMQKLGFSPELISFADSHLQPSNEEQQAARDKFNEIKNAFKKETDAEKLEVMKLGGLAVIGTALNTSRRVDNQLRGRAGRQGEPGSSEIFVAWDDMRQNFNVGEDSEEYYLDLVRKRKVDTSKEITDPKIITQIENMQKSAESQLTQARKSNYYINTPENMQRIAIFSEKEEIIKICDEFDPNDVELSDQASTKFEQYLFGLYQADISKIVDDYQLGKKFDDDFSPTENSSDEDYKRSGDYLRNNLKKYGFNTSKITDLYLQTTEPGDIKNDILTLSKKIFKKAINETKDYYPHLIDFIKSNIILKEYDDAWQSHLHRLEQAKFQFDIAQMTNQNAINDFCKDSYNFFILLKDKVRTKVIESINKQLSYCVTTERAMKEEKAKKEVAEKQSSQKTKEQE